MSTKLVFAIESVALCEQIVDKLRALGITEESIGVIASDKTALPALPDAQLMKNDVIPAVQRGGATGAITGVVAGIVMTMASPGIVIGGAGLALAALGGASFGALSSALIGASVPNSHLQEYETALSNGNLLLIVEVVDEEVSHVRNTLSQYFPSLKLEKEISGISPIS